MAALLSEGRSIGRPFVRDFNKSVCKSVRDFNDLLSILVGFFGSVMLTSWISRPELKSDLIKLRVVKFAYNLNQPMNPIQPGP